MQFHTHRVLLLSTKVFFLIGTALLIFTFSVFRRAFFQNNGNRDYFTIDTKSRNISSSNRIPICIENLLDAQKYNFREWATKFDDVNLLFNSDSKSSCRLLRYSPEMAVKCIDTLIFEKEQYKPSAGLHFVFIGDSRIRQQFLNFLTLIPKFDRKTKPDPLPFYLHDDMEITSNLLKLRVSFQWRPLLDSQSLTTIKQYLDDTQSRPDWILLGFELHHMLSKNNTSLPVYLKRIQEIAPLLNQLGKLIKVVWLNQYPSISDYKENDEDSKEIFPEAIHMYNQATRSIIKLFRNVHYWDSSNKLAEEYIRGCLLIRRNSEYNSIHGYVIECSDYLHIGNVVQQEATHLLFNDLCNSRLNNLID